MAKPTPAGGGESPAGGQPDESVLDYLRNAPEELQPWAREKLAEFGDDAVAPPASDEPEADQPEQPETAAEPTSPDIASHAVEAGILEENDLALAELGEMDDDQRRAVRKARKRAKRTAPAPVVVDHADAENRDSGTNRDSGKTSAAPAARKDATPRHQTASPIERAPEKKSKAFTILVVAALSLGLAFGVFMIGADDQKPLDANQLPDGHPDISQMEAPMPAAADHSQRIFELDMALRQNPDDWEARLEKGVLLMNQRDYEEAEEEWLIVLEGTEGHPEAYYNLGFLYTQMDPPRFDDAIASWESLIELDPDSELAVDVEPFYDTLVAGPPDAPDEMSDNTP